MYAKEAEILLGAIALKAYQMPDGEYLFSQESCCGAIEKARNSMQLVAGGKSKYSENLSNALQGSKVVRVQNSKARIKGVSIEVAFIFWSYWADKGDQSARAVLAAAAMETITRRFDKVFGVKKTEADYNDQFEQNRQLWQKGYKQAIEGITTRLDSEVEMIQMDDSFTLKEKKEALADLKKEQKAKLSSAKADFEPMIAMWS